MKDREYWNRTFTAPDPWDYGSDYEQTKYRHTLELLPEVRPRRAIELGCAEGVFTARLASRVGHLTAVDISDVALQRARDGWSDLGNVEFAQWDISSGIPGADYDLIVCSEILYYLRDAAAVVGFAAKCWAALEPGGHLLMTHANMVSDDRSTTGFDFNEIGARFIGETFAGHPGFDFVRELRTELYRVQLFRKTVEGTGDFSGQRERGSAPQEVVVRKHASITHASIKWGGCLETAAEARHGWVTEDLPILMYHRVAWDGPRSLAPYRVAPARFERQLAWLQRHGWHSVRLGDHMRATGSGGSRTVRGKAIALTFDDAYADFATHAWPLLQRYGFSATLFVPVDFVGGCAEWDAEHGEPARLLTWDQLRTLRDEGVEIGSHGCTHRRLHEISPEEVSDDCRRSRQILRAELGVEAAGFAYPYGWADPASRAAVVDAGYRYAVSGTAEVPQDERDSYFLRRVEILGVDKLDDFVRRLPVPRRAPAEEIVRFHELRSRRDRATYMDV